MWIDTRLFYTPCNLPLAARTLYAREYVAGSVSDSTHELYIAQISRGQHIPYREWDGTQYKTTDKDWTTAFNTLIDTTLHGSIHRACRVGSDYSIDDGHHRIACAHVLNRPIWCEVTPFSKCRDATWMQRTWNLTVSETDNLETILKEIK